MISKALFEFERSLAMAMMHWHPTGNVKMIFVRTYVQLNSIIIIISSSSSNTASTPPPSPQPANNNSRTTTTIIKEDIVDSSRRWNVEKQANFPQKYWTSHACLFYLFLTHSADALLAANNSVQTILECCQCILLLVCLLIYGCTNRFRRQAINMDKCRRCAHIGNRRPFVFAGLSHSNSRP